MAHDKDNSSPLAGILMTAFFGIISIILGAVTMYQVHSIWVKYHHQRKENRDLDIEHQNSSTSICLPPPSPSEWHSTPSPSSSLPALDQTYTIPPRRQEELFRPDEGKVSEEKSDEETDEGVTTITTRCFARDDDGSFDVALVGVVSRFSSDSDSDDGKGDEDGLGEGMGIVAPPGTPVSERMEGGEGFGKIALVRDV